jgi:dsDNA-binding SOS-regulon protein
MDKFIIKYTTRVNGEEKMAFHEKISLTNPNRLDIMNVYVEHISFDKSKAMVFYDREEAEKVSVLFGNSIHVGKVVKK